MNLISVQKQELLFARLMSSGKTLHKLAEPSRTSSKSRKRGLTGCRILVRFYGFRVKQINHWTSVVECMHACVVSTPLVEWGAESVPGGLRHSSCHSAESWTLLRFGL